jgi:hypothetical protein
MGEYERRVHFGAVNMKRGKKSCKFPTDIFGPLFTYNDLKISYNILVTHNKNYI